MKSVKPGRLSSAKAVAGGIIGIAFGCVWTFMAYRMGAPVFFPIFGVLFVMLAAVETIIALYNTTAKNRFSVVDITEETEEPDPLNQRFSAGEEADLGDNLVEDDYLQSDLTEPVPGQEDAVRFCPWCGRRLGGNYSYCPGCGKELPKD